MTLRIYADRGSISDGAYWCLRYNGASVDDVADIIGLHDGLEVIVYYKDEEEEYELDGKVYLRPTGPKPAPQWVAEVDNASFRRIR
jgi:hypothetical protein